MTDEIEYRYVKGQGWVAGYKHPTLRLEDIDWSELQRKVLAYVNYNPRVYHPRTIAYMDGI